MPSSVITVVVGRAGAFPVSCADRIVPPLQREGAADEKALLQYYFGSVPALVGTTPFPRKRLDKCLLETPIA